MKPEDLQRRHKLTAIDMALAFILILFGAQIWLLTAAVEADLGGDHGISLPSLLASLVCFGFNARLLKYIMDLDRQQ